MFNEPQLLLIFRVALEIEKVYGFPNDSDHSEEPTANIQITGNEIIPLDGALTLTPDHLDDFGTTGEGKQLDEFITQVRITCCPPNLNYVRCVARNIASDPDIKSRI